MTASRRVHVNIDRLVVDGPVDERALRVAIARELGGTLPREQAEVRAGATEHAAARAVVERLHGTDAGPGRRAL